MYKPLLKGGKAVPELGAKLDSLFLTPILNAVFFFFFLQSVIPVCGFILPSFGWVT